MQVCGDIMGSKLWEFFQGPLVRHHAPLPIFFSGISFLSMEDCAPSTSLGNWALVVLYLCSRFRIFNRPILEEYVYQVEGGPHLFRSCLCVARDSLILTTKEMHLFLKI